MKSIAAFFLLLFVGLQQSKAQDTLTLLNGKVMVVKIEAVSNENISFQLIDAKKQSFQERSTEEIFSFQKKGKAKVQVYKYNPDIGNFYQINEMKQFMLGERHADAHHNTLWTKISALSVGAASGYLLSEGSGVIAAVPVVYASIMTLPKARIQKNSFNAELIDEQPYRAGYSRVAKGKRFLNNFGYSALGMFSSFILFEVVKNN